VSEHAFVSDFMLPAQQLFEKVEPLTCATPILYDTISTSFVKILNDKRPLHKLHLSSDIKKRFRVDRGIHTIYPHCIFLGLLQYMYGAEYCHVTQHTAQIIPEYCHAIL
jgi:hypothetical protein